MNPQEQQRINDALDKLRKEYEELRSAFYLNNFLTSQDFNKNSRFNTGLKIPHYDTLPAACETGQIAENSGKLYICSAADTWTVAGTQT